MNNILRTWVEIDSKILEKNILLMRSSLKKHVAFAGLVKANAYGHGLVEVAKILIKQQARFIAVAYWEEAYALRKAGIRHPILMLSQPWKKDIENIIQYKVTPAIYSVERAKEIAACAKKRKAVVPIHIKIDTGLHRLGFSPEDAVTSISKIAKMAGLRIEGLYTHFVNSYATDLSFTKKQLRIYEQIVTQLASVGITPSYLHTANSAALVWVPESQYHLVRFGLTMYGLQPSDETVYPLPIQQCLTWKTRVLQVNKIKKGDNVGYGNAWHAPKDMKIATIALGYSDGFRRTPYNFGFVLCHGQKVPIISNVQMSQTMIDVSGIVDVTENDEIVIIGKQGKERITFEDVSTVTGTTNEEIVTNISTFIPRIYI